MCNAESAKRSAPGLYILVVGAVALGIAVVLAILPQGSAKAFDLDQANCLSCHSNPSLTKTFDNGTAISLYVNVAERSLSAHRYLDCTTCHSGTPHDVKTPLSKLSLAQKCGSCHQYEYKQHLTSIHGQQLASGNPDVATCTDCHSTDSNPHDVVRVLEPGASTYPKNIAQTCAKCHNDPKLMGKYGIVEKVYESYMRSFHGKAMELASDKVAVELLNKATCINCHGTHDIQKVDAANAPVSGVSNLAKTCEQCHPGAGVTFAAGFLGHREAEPDFLPVVYWGEKFFYILTRVVLATGAMMVALAIGRWAYERICYAVAHSKKED
ncbi:MAG: cytochrome c3 family protein [Dehalococcoidia bacterium]|nr:cytochrome c3 family protein [Dehalococcoidia bacterium]